jgi:hydrogenase nickel incorporation protein HypA/HybF
MHEWALAESVITAITQVAKRENLKSITEVKIKLGELQQIEMDIFKFAIQQLISSTFKNAKIIIEVGKAKLECKACGTKWEFEKEELTEDTKEAIHFVPEIAHSFIKCPKCNSPDFEILQGRGVWLEKIKGVKNPD